MQAELAEYRVPERVARVWARAGAWAGRLFLAVVDQGLISGANFAVGILLARWMMPAEDGAYALAVSVFVRVGGPGGLMVLRAGAGIAGPDAPARDAELLVGVRADGGGRSADERGVVVAGAAGALARKGRSGSRADLAPALGLRALGPGDIG